MSIFQWKATRKHPCGRNGEWTLFCYGKPLGIRVLWCGHPTALRPYYGEADWIDEMILDPVTDLAFVSLRAAQHRCLTLALAHEGLVPASAAQPPPLELT